jgi:hypothetical protein
MAEDVPENQKTTIDGVGLVENWPYPYGPHENTTIGNDYQGQGSIELYPQGNEGNKDYHPYELEYHVDDDSNAELRCYYGVIYYSIAAIQTEAFTVSTTTYFGIKSQSPIPGIGICTPAGFINQGTGATEKFASLPLGKVSEDGTLPAKAFGTVYVRFWVDALNHLVKGADLNFVAKGGKLEAEGPIGELKKVNNNLFRNPNTGRYHLKIGSFNAPEDTIVPITQCIEDHIYYATTIVDKSGGTESDYSDGTIATTENTDPDRFTIEGKQPDIVIPGAERPEESTTTYDNNTTLGPGTGTGTVLGGVSETFNPRDYNTANPDYTNLKRYMDKDGVVEYYQQQFEWNLQQDPVVVPAQDVDGAFGGTGAAGTGGTSDLTGYNASAATLPHNIEDETAAQLFGPEGSAGGSATSSSYSY